MPSFRIGHGYDVHRLVEGRPLVIGGITIPHRLGLDGHSDADVLLHVIADALLGAAALRDIGYHFPDTDETYKGVDSGVLLQKVYKLVREKGYIVGNIDATILAQKPKLSAHIPAMIARVSELLTTDPDRINIKATTEEHLGFTGAEQGIAAHAIALIYRG